MKRYSKIPVWETKRRIRLLDQFRQDILDYFDATQIAPAFGGRIETDESRAIKPRINLKMQTAQHAIAAAGITTEYTHIAAPVAGGHHNLLDLVQNIFHLDDWQIPYDTAIAMIERAIGVYSDDLSSAKLRTANPFWWMGKFISWFAQLPFKALRGAGFNTVKAEQSVIGRLVTLLTGAIPVITGLLYIITTLGMLNQLKSLLGLT